MSESRPRQETTVGNRQSKIKSLVCPVCNKGPFSNFNGLSQHHQRIHGEQLPPDVRLANSNWCEQKYVEERLSFKRISELCDTSLYTARKWIRKHDFETRPKYGEQDNSEYLHDFNWLWEQRWEKDKTTREIASEIDVSKVAVEYWLDKYNIGGRVHPYIDDEDILYHLYIVRDENIHDLASQYNCNKSTILERCNEYGISKDVHRINAVGLRWAEPFIREKYLEEGWTTTEIADYFNLSGSARLIEVMEDFGIERRGRSYYSGEKSKQWEGGRTGNYKGDWLSARNEARERDDYTCQRCGVNESEMDRELDVHHIRPYRKFEDKSEAHNLDNLISLCSSCHGVVEAWPVKIQQ